MVANITRSNISQVQNIQDSFNFFQGLYSSYPVLKWQHFATLIAEIYSTKCDFAKVKVIEQNKWHHQIP